MGVPKYRIFFDTSAYIAGLHSSTGAARELLRLAETEAIQAVVSEEVVLEADRVVMAKFPELAQESRNLWKKISPLVVDTPTIDKIGPFLHLLPKSDAAILCAAHSAKVSAFVMWNTRDFMVPNVQSLVDFPIVVPADGLKLFRAWIEPFLD